MEPQIQRWSAKRKVELLLSSITRASGSSWMSVGSTTFKAVRGRELDGDLPEVRRARAEGAFRRRAGAHEKELKDLRAKVGELVLELDARKNGKLSTAAMRRPSDVAERDASRRR